MIPRAHSIDPIEMPMFVRFTDDTPGGDLLDDPKFLRKAVATAHAAALKRDGSTEVCMCGICLRHRGAPA